MTIASIIKIVASVGILAFGVTSIFENRKNVWEIEDNEELFEILWDSILKKSHYGEKRKALNEKEQVFFIMAELEMEVNNGGFDQFFFNTGDAWNDILVHSAEEIKAIEIAGICKKALDIQDSLLSEDEKMDKLNECDTAFYGVSEDVSGLCVQYARQNPKYFNVIRIISK